MARPGQTESASVPIWLKLSDADAARMDQVLARPEFAGWTRAEWCLEVIQTALRYYTRTRPDAGPTPEPETETAPEPAPEPQQAAAEPAPQSAAAEPPGQPECSHPAEARDYQSGTCRACGAILWD